MTSTESSTPSTTTTKNKRESRRVLRADTTKTKIVRLRWQDPKPEEKADGENRCKKRRFRGCYFGANLKGKLRFGCGRGKSSLWTLHELNNGELLFSPLSAPRRFLRLHADGSVNLSNGGCGKKTRWGINSSSEGSQRIVSRFVPNFTLVGVSVGKRNKDKSEKPEQTRTQKQDKQKNKKKVVPRGLDLTTAPTNIVANSFHVEEVDTAKELSKVISRQSSKRRAIKQLAKEGGSGGKKKANKLKPKVSSAGEKDEGRQQRVRLSVEERAKLKAQRRMEKLEKKKKLLWARA